VRLGVAERVRDELVDRDVIDVADQRLGLAIAADDHHGRRLRDVGTARDALVARDLRDGGRLDDDLAGVPVDPRELVPDGAVVRGARGPEEEHDDLVAGDGRADAALEPVAGAVVSSPAAFAAADSAVAFAASARWASCPAALSARGPAALCAGAGASGSAVTGLGFRTVIHAAMNATAQTRRMRMGGEIWDIAPPPSAFRSIV
jgi:hypothetical protein